MIGLAERRPDNIAYNRVMQLDGGERFGELTEPGGNRISGMSRTMQAANSLPLPCHPAAKPRACFDEMPIEQVRQITAKIKKTVFKKYPLTQDSYRINSFREAANLAGS